METKTVQTLAAECATYLQTKTREDGTTFVTSTQDAPDWFIELVRTAHDDMLPDDHRYQMIEDAILAMADSDEPGDTLYEVEAPVYTSDLTAWLNSANSRVYYLTEALTEYGDIKDGFQLLSLAWLAEFREVAQSVLSSLEAKLQEDES